MFTPVKLNSLFDREMRVYYLTQVLNQRFNIYTTTDSNLETRIKCKYI